MESSYNSQYYAQITTAILVLVIGLYIVWWQMKDFSIKDKMNRISLQSKYFINGLAIGMIFITTFIFIGLFMVGTKYQFIYEGLLQIFFFGGFPFVVLIPGCIGFLYGLYIVMKG